MEEAMNSEGNGVGRPMRFEEWEETRSVSRKLYAKHARRGWHPVILAQDPRSHIGDGDRGHRVALFLGRLALTPPS